MQHHKASRGTRKLLKVELSESMLSSACLLLRATNRITSKTATHLIRGINHCSHMYKHKEAYILQRTLSPIQTLALRTLCQVFLTLTRFAWWIQRQPSSTVGLHCIRE